MLQPSPAASTREAVLIAADPYWIRTVVGGPAVPGKADASIRPEGWPDVAAAIRTARRTAGPGWSFNLTSSTRVTGPALSGSFIA